VLLCARSRNANGFLSFDGEGQRKNLHPWCKRKINKFKDGRPRARREGDARASKGRGRGESVFYGPLRGARAQEGRNKPHLPDVSPQ